MYFVFNEDGPLIRKFHVEDNLVKMMIDSIGPEVYVVKSDENISHDTHYYDGANTIRIRETPTPKEEIPNEVKLKSMVDEYIRAKAMKELGIDVDIEKIKLQVNTLNKTNISVK